MRPGFDPLVGKIPWRRERLPTPVFWPGEFHGLYGPRDRKESDTTEQGRPSLSLSLFPSSQQSSQNDPCKTCQVMSFLHAEPSSGFRLTYRRPYHSLNPCRQWEHCLPPNPHPFLSQHSSLPPPPSATLCSYPMRHVLTSRTERLLSPWPPPCLRAGLRLPLL